MGGYYLEHCCTSLCVLGGKKRGGVNSTPGRRGRGSRGGKKTTSNNKNKKTVNGMTSFIILMTSYICTCGCVGRVVWP